MTEEYIQHPMIESLPDHTIQLKEITRIITNLQKKFDLGKQSYPALTEKQVETMEYVMDKCLRKVADLSMSLNIIQKDMEEHYILTYSKTPAIGKKLYLNHYFSLHKPYDKVKNKSWKFIFILKKYKKDNF